MNLSRSRHGTMIHERDCRYAVNATPWLWAENRSEHEIARTCVYFGYQTCLACRPLGDEVVRMAAKVKRGLA